MKKHDLKTLALMGLTGGLLLGQQGAAAKDPDFQETPWENMQEHKCNGPHGCPGSLPNHECGSKCGGLTALRDKSADQDLESPANSKDQQKQDSDPNQGNMHYHLMTEQELLIELNTDGVRMYNSLDDEGKALARRVASMMCQGTNECKGLNGCMTDKNTCAGKGDCRGKGKCALSDKNLAVKLVYDKMAAKRANMMNK